MIPFPAYVFRVHVQLAIICGREINHYTLFDMAKLHAGNNGIEYAAEILKKKYHFPLDMQNNRRRIRNVN